MSMSTSNYKPRSTTAGLHSTSHSSRSKSPVRSTSPLPRRSISPSRLHNRSLSPSKQVMLYFVQVHIKSTTFVQISAPLSPCVWANWLYLNGQNLKYIFHSKTRKEQCSNFSLVYHPCPHLNSWPHRFNF